jgi:ATP-dependent DNA helicase RecG
MILDYVRAHGSIARSEAAELCQISPVQARYLLKGLVDQGRLNLVGERRAARYELAGGQATQIRPTETRD